MCVLLILYISTHLVVVLSYHEINEIKSNQLILFITAVIDDPTIHHIQTTIEIPHLHVKCSDLSI